MMQNKKTKLIINQRNSDYYMKLWGLKENNSNTAAHIFVKQYAPEPHYLPKNRFLKDWDWKQNFKSLEEATEFLLNYCTELGPLSKECLQRLNKNAETIRQLTLTNKQLRKGFITNDCNKENRQE